MKRKWKIMLYIGIPILLAMIVWIIWGNKALELNAYTVTSADLPTSFDGFRIAHVSDLHNTEMGENNEKLLAMLRDAKPDMIAITGDLIDSRSTDIPLALRFVEEAMKIAPCYFVSGNHELRIAEYEEFLQSLTDLGVVILDNTQTEIIRNGEKITVMGLRDPNLEMQAFDGDAPAIVQQYLHAEEGFVLLLSHRPELFEVYVKNEIDLALTGHAHGGQARFPFVGGLIAPQQGLFPKYDAGLFEQGDTRMIISRGIGNSAFPFRFNNRPEVILITLKTV